MVLALWIVQGLLAAMFLMAGSMKALSPKEKLLPRLPVVADLPEWGVKVIGVLEFTAALGLILPLVTGIAPVLTPFAATGLVLTMVGAIIFHVRRKEPKDVIINLVILAMALFVAYGRFVLVPVVA